MKSIDYSGHRTRRTIGSEKHQERADARGGGVPPPAYTGHATQYRLQCIGGKTLNTCPNARDREWLEIVDLD